MGLVQKIKKNERASRERRWKENKAPAGGKGGLERTIVAKKGETWGKRLVIGVTALEKDIGGKSSRL